MAPLEFPDAIEVIDSHTEGEPTRVVVAGWPRLEAATMEGRRDEVAARWDHLRRAVVCEPRGHDAVIGALLTEPVSEGAAAGVVFFNNAGCLGMCGHGLIGLVRTLADLGRLGEGLVTLDTPVGPVAARLEADGAVTIRNVPSWAERLDVAIEVPGVGRVVGDVGWGGNWFFLVRAGVEGPIEPAELDRLLAVTRAIRGALDEADPLAGGGIIDHVEIFGPSPRADSRNFVLCPGGEYDRSPCGTGTSAKMAVLYARGELAPGQRWRQESVTGGIFEGWIEEVDGELVPWIRGRAWVTGRGRLEFADDDPFRGGFTVR